MEQNGMNAQNTSSNMAASAVPDQPMTLATPEAPAVEPKTDGNKRSRGMVVALVLCLLLALGGIGFGIWAMIDGNARVGRLNEQVASLQDQNAKLTEEVEKLNIEVEDLLKPSELPVAENWTSTAVEDGVFYVLDEHGHTVAQSSLEGVTINEILGCESSAEDTVLTCTVNTSAGEGWFLYDVYGDSLTSSFDVE